MRSVHLNDPMPLILAPQALSFQSSVAPLRTSRKTKTHTRTLYVSANLLELYNRAVRLHNIVLGTLSETPPRPDTSFGLYHRSSTKPQAESGDQLLHMPQSNMQIVSTRNPNESDACSPCNCYSLRLTAAKVHHHGHTRHRLYHYRKISLEVAATMQLAVMGVAEILFQ